MTILEMIEDLYEYNRSLLESNTVQSEQMVQILWRGEMAIFGTLPLAMIPDAPQSLIGIHAPKHSIVQLYIWRHRSHISRHLAAHKCLFSISGHANDNAQKADMGVLALTQFSDHSTLAIIQGISDYLYDMRIGMEVEKEVRRERAQELKVQRARKHLRLVKGVRSA